jgi:hypothetical protein
MEIIEFIKQGLKKRLIVNCFCLGISIDQITPFYHHLKYVHTISGRDNYFGIRNIDKQKTVSKSKFKNNFGKRVKFQQSASR